MNVISMKPNGKRNYENPMAQYLPELNNIRQDFFAPSIHKVSEGVKRLDC